MLKVFLFIIIRHQLITKLPQINLVSHGFSVNDHKCATHTHTHIYLQQKGNNNKQ